jgi:hypothetical protein
MSDAKTRRGETGCSYEQNMALAYDMVPRVEDLSEKPARKKGLITRIVT